MPEWKDLTMMEDPWEQLEIKPAQWTPEMLQERMLKITNGLTNLYRQQGEHQKTISEMGGKKAGGQSYTITRGNLYIIEAKIEALKIKHDTLRSVNSSKNAELQHTR